MKLRAKKKAFINGNRVRVGEIIELDVQKCPLWAEEVGGDAEPAKKAPFVDKPTTLKDLAKGGERVEFVGEKPAAKPASEKK